MEKQVRFVFVFVAVVFGWYCMAMVRTQFFGISLRSVAAQFYFAGVGALVISFLGYSFLTLIGKTCILESFLLQLIIIIALAISLSEMWASTEEYLFKQQVGDSVQSVSKGRWFPFENHGLGYNKVDGFYAHE